MASNAEWLRGFCAGVAIAWPIASLAAVAIVYFVGAFNGDKDDERF
jgi:hypothetical protein